MLITGPNTFQRQFITWYRLIKESLSGKEQVYTSGSIRRAVVLLAVPMMLEMSLESVFAVVDIYFVNELGPNAVSVVGLTEAVMALIYSVAVGLSAAATAVVSRRMGEQDAPGARSSAAHSLVLALVVSMALGFLGYLGSEWLLQMMGTEPQAIQEGLSYTRIMLGSCGVVVFIFLINGIFRGAGNATIAMHSLWLANGINIVLCPVLIKGLGPFPELGIAGAAWATVIGRGSGVLYQVYHLYFAKRAWFKQYPHSGNYAYQTFQSLLNIGTPATLQFLVQSASWIVLAALVAQHGSEASAGYQTAIRLFLFFLLPAWGISNAAATLVGQNLGARESQRAQDSVSVIVKYNTYFMAVVTLLFFVLAKPLLQAFIGIQHPTEMHYATQALYIICSGYVLYGLGMVYMQAFNGAGDTKTPTYISLFGFWLFQIPFAFVLSRVLKLGPLGVFIAIPVAEGIMAFLYWWYFKKGNWKLNKV